jgi:methylaspartate mutase epsilon subunit
MKAVLPCPASPPRSGFSAFVRKWSAQGELVLQPRMGFGCPCKMREGLARVREADALTVGTITLDSFTRLGNYTAAENAVAMGDQLNGYPLLAYSPGTSREILAGIADHDFPVQVRHGTPLPQQVFRAMLAAGLQVTEGGPVSYALPYGREPLANTLDAWADACSILRTDEAAHIESFGGCMLGQLCPPSLLIALSVLEAMFMRQHGIMSVSLSYAQQTNAEQDVEALCALRLLADELLGDMDWHIVLYSFMGMFPASLAGAARLSEASVAIALAGAADRLIVKTKAEAHRIPTITENIEALEAAHKFARTIRGERIGEPFRQRTTGAVLTEARTLIWSTLRLDSDIGEALREAFLRGLLDVPFCLHPDNHNRSRPHLDELGRLSWAIPGAMPVRIRLHGAARCSSADLIAMLSYNARKYDVQALKDLDGTPSQLGIGP